jgi:hypothetical protein
MTIEEAHKILQLPVTRNFEGMVAAYLIELIQGILHGTASEKYGFTGNDDWRYDIYEAIGDAGLVGRDEHGYVDDDAAQSLLVDALHLVAPAA